jgi:Flp pilus assembly protein TadG
MTWSMLQKFSSRQTSMLRSLRRDNRGVAAVEFAMIVPIMLSLFIGTVEMSQAITVNRRVSQIAYTTSDLVSRETTISVTQLGNVTELAKVLMRPYDTGPLKISIINVVADINDEKINKVAWSHQFQGGVNGAADGSSYSMQDGTTSKGCAVIIAEVAYNYTPILFAKYMPGVTELKDKFMFKPRNSCVIPKTNT